MFDCYNRKIEYLRISVTDRCNLRCTYCMPAEGIEQIAHAEVLSFEEIAEVARRAVGMGVKKVRLTGGEPLVRRGILTLVEMLAAIDGIEDLAMTTNGILLAQFAQPLKEAGLHRLNISLDALQPDRYREVTRGGEVQEVLDGIQAARDAGLKPLKINCVINESAEEPDAVEVADYARSIGAQIRFIRCMDIQEGTFWTVDGGDGGNCAICNRLRLTSDGKIFPCLFNNTHYSVKEHGIEKALALAVENKPESGKPSSDNQFYAMGG